MNITSIPAPSFASGKTFLEMQDQNYASRRLPYKTQPGTENRTFLFRVEGVGDLAPLQAVLGWAVETWWSSPMSPYGDADVKMTLREDALTLEEVRLLMDLVDDAHVAVETVALEASYLGIRRYKSAEELGAKVPSLHALRQASEGLSEHAQALEMMQRRACRADERVWGHLPMDWAPI